MVSVNRRSVVPPALHMSPRSLHRTTTSGCSLRGAPRGAFWVGTMHRRPPERRIRSGRARQRWEGQDAIDHPRHTRRDLQGDGELLCADRRPEVVSHKARFPILPAEEFRNRERGRWWRMVVHIRVMSWVALAARETNLVKSEPMRPTLPGCGGQLRPAFSCPEVARDHGICRTLFSSLPILKKR